jgi:hypothetical protein
VPDPDVPALGQSPPRPDRHSMTFALEAVGRRRTPLAPSASPPGPIPRGLTGVFCCRRAPFIRGYAWQDESVHRCNGAFADDSRVRQARSVTQATSHYARIVGPVRLLLARGRDPRISPTYSPARPDCSTRFVSQARQEENSRQGRAAGLCGTPHGKPEACCLELDS